MKINLQCSAKLNSKYKTTIIPLIEKENMLPYLKKFLNLENSKSNKKMIQDLEKQIKPTNNLSTSLFIELKGETYHLLLSTIDFKKEEASQLKLLVKASSKKEGTSNEKKGTFSEKYETSSTLKNEKFGAILDHIRNRGAETYKECQANKLLAANVAMMSHYHDKMNGMINIAFLEGFLLAMYSFDKYKTLSSKKDKEDKEDSKNKLSDLHLVFPDNNASKIKEIDQETKDLLIKIKSVYLARDLSNEPGSSLSPKNFIDTIKGFISFHKVPVSVEVINTAQLKKMGMNLMVSVGNGSRPDYQSHFLIIKYFPNSNTKSSTKSSKKSKKKNRKQSNEEANNSSNNNNNNNNNNQEGGRKSKKSKKKSKSDISSTKSKENSKENPDYVLLGKGVTFDTGGISLKRSKNLNEMKYDMSGAAVVSSFILGHAKTKGKESVVALVPLAENNVGPGATLPGDVIKSYSGKTVEILDTDGEGRLLLADALSYAEEKYPNSKMIDLATLAGFQDKFSCGNFSNVMTRHKDFVEQIKASGDFIQEKMVETPYIPKFEKYLESHIADITNIARNCSSGLITSGIFLSQFISKDTVWAHLDIAGPAWKQTSKKYNQKEASGVGVRFLFDLIN